MAANSNLSKDFFDLVKAIGESRSKQEEDKIIAHEVQVLKGKMAAKDVTSKKMKEYLIRLIYCEMLGHDASFGYIHAVNMVTSKTLLEKRVGYLTVSLALHPDHSFMLLLINSLLQDLKSDNFLEVSCALTVVCKLANHETIPALLPIVTRMLDHKQANIRKKAVMCLHRFYEIDPNSIATLTDKIRKVLCDKDPCVMGASLCLFEDIASVDPGPYKDLTPSFVSILKQVTEHRLPRDYDYHRMPAPWIQLKLLKIMAHLGAADKRTSEGMYEILQEVMKRADIGINVGYSIVYECVRTITSIYPSSALLEEAAVAIARFLSSDNNNLKYLGVNALAAIVQINPKYAAEHQMVVIDCLEDSDETLKHKTLDLLFSMTNPNNVVVIVDKLTNFLRQTTDQYLKGELVSRITQLAEKYSPSSRWFLETMNNVFELGGDLVKPEVAHSLMKLIAETEVDANGEELRVHAVETYLNLLQSTKKHLPNIMLQVLSWVLGEFGHVGAAGRREMILEILLNSADRQFDNHNTRSWLLQALLKLSAHLPTIPPRVMDLVAEQQRSLHLDLQQRAQEFYQLSQNVNTMRSVVPLQGCTEQLDVSETLDFLDGYVDTALRAGAPAYKEPHLRQTDNTQSDLDEYAKKHAPKDLTQLKFENYPTVQQNSAPAPVERGPSMSGGFGGGAGGGGGGGGAKKGGPWSAAGYNQGGKPQQQQAEVHQDPYASTARPEPVVSQPVAPAPVAKREPVPAKPRELTEKEKMAAALFSGLAPGSGAAGARPGTTTATAKKPVSAAAPAAAARPAQPAAVAKPAAQPKQEIDIFGGLDQAMSSSQPQQPQQSGARPAAAPAKPKDDLAALLEDAFSASVPAAAPVSGAGNSLGNLWGQPQPQPGQPLQQQPSFDPFGMSAGPAVPSAGPAPSAPKPAAPAAPIANLDPFADLWGGGSSSNGSGGASSISTSNPAPVNGGGAPQRVGAAGMSDTLRQRLSAMACGQEAVLLSDNTWHVSCTKAWADTATWCALHVTNKRPQPAQNVALELNLPIGVSVQFDGEPKATVRSASATSHSLLISAIAPAATSTQIIMLQFSEQTLTLPNLVIAGQLSGAGLPSRAAFSLPLSVRDLVRGCPMNTSQFGGLWKTFTAEAKFQLNATSCPDSATLMNRMRGAGVSPVETIGQENIISGRLCSAQQTLCLFHVKLRAGPALDIIVRTKNAGFTKHLAGFVNSVLA